MKQKPSYIQVMNHSLLRVFHQTLRFSLRKPSYLFFILRSIRKQQHAAKIRWSWERRGIHVPPYLIMSITHQCNLRCKGCYARAQHRDATAELSVREWQKILSEASELGISVILIAGGEPLIRHEVIDLISKYRDIIFPVFTNGMLLDDETLRILARHRHMIPVISVEGFATATDLRRGAGVFDKILLQLKRLKNGGIFYGVSVTVTRENFDVVTGREFIQAFLEEGCKIFFFVEYIPVAENTASLAPDNAQREQLTRLTRDYQTQFDAILVAFPGDESMYDGCLAAGRGFIHISPDGSLEPCPFAPYSDSNVKNHSLKEALQSKFLQEIRTNHANLKETECGCALWNNREWVGELLGHPNQKEFP